MATSTSRLNDDSPADEEGRSGQVKELLAEHVPISLLMDLLPPTGPDSQDILDTEGAPAHAWWEQP